MCNFYTEIYREKGFLNFVDDLSLRHFAPQDIENYRIQPEHLIGWTWVWWKAVEILLTFSTISWLQCGHILFNTTCKYDWNFCTSFSSSFSPTVVLAKFILKSGQRFLYEMIQKVNSFVSPSVNCFMVMRCASQLLFLLNIFIMHSIPLLNVLHSINHRLSSVTVIFLGGITPSP